MLRWSRNRRMQWLAALLVAALLAPLVPGTPAAAEPVLTLDGTAAVSKSTIYIGEEFTITYTLSPRALGGYSGRGNFKFPKIAQPIPYGFAVVAYSGSVFNDEVEIKYNELLITFNDIDYDTNAHSTRQVTVKLVYKGKPAVHQFGQARLTYVLNDDWGYYPVTRINMPTLTFVNPVEGPSTRMTDPRLEGELTAPQSHIWIGEPFRLQYDFSPSIEIERRDQSDYIVLWDISGSMSQRYVPADVNTRIKIDVARSGFQAFIDRLRSYYPGDTEEAYTELPNAGTTITAGAAPVENRFVPSLTKSKPLKRRTGPQVGTAPRVTFIPFTHDILYDHIIEQSNNYSYMLHKVNNLMPSGARTDVTRALHETMDYILFEREHGDPSYRPTIIIVTDGGFDSYTRINGEQYEFCYCTSSKTAGEINLAVEHTYDFDNLYLAMEIPLHLIKLANPNDRGLNYTEGFNALENIVQRSGGAIYTTLGANDLTYEGSRYRGTIPAFSELVDRTEANKKPWAAYREIALNQRLPSGVALAGSNPGAALENGSLRLPVQDVDYNSGRMELSAPVTLVYNGAPATYVMQDGVLAYKANGANKQSTIAGRTLVFKKKSPPKAEVQLPSAPNVMIEDDFMIVRGKEPPFAIKAEDEENIAALRYAFAAEENETPPFVESSGGSAGLGKAFRLAFNEGPDSTVKRFEQYGWYKMTIVVDNTLGLTTTKVMYVLVLPPLTFGLNVQDAPAGAISAKPLTVLTEWDDASARKAIPGKFGMPGVRTAVDYSLAGGAWKPAKFDKLQVVRQSAAQQELKVGVTQTFEPGAAPAFDAIQFRQERSVMLAIDYDQKKY